MVVGAKVCDLTEDLLWFVCGLYVGILTSPLRDFRRKQTLSKQMLTYCLSICANQTRAESDCCEQNVNKGLFAE